jgi:cation diffusion facilitator CzcD-associated flavoprotein CzcO
MNTKEILNHIKGKDVVIIGPPASGKTFLSKLLESPAHTVLHTDDYVQFGYKEALYVLLNDLKHVDGNVIIEGVQGYRLLRKGVELSCYYPQVVIELQITQERMEQTYREQRPGKDFSYVKSFNKMHAKIKADYLAMENPSKPEWITIQNNY